MKTLYIKYNRERLVKFQTETKVIEDDNGKRQVVKRPLTPFAENHVSRMIESYGLLKQAYHQLTITNVYLNEDLEACFDYVQGLSLNQLLVEALIKKKKPAFYSILDRYKKLLASCSEPVILKSNNTFRSIFDCVPDSDDPQNCMKIANLDMTFDNLIHEDDHLTLIDYEWVFNFPIQTAFIAYRSIVVFYIKHHEYVDHVTSLDEIFQFFDIDSSGRDLFSRMDQQFKAYVFGNGQNAHNAKYMKSFVELLPVSEYKAREEWTIRTQNERISQDKFILEQNEKLKHVSDWAQSISRDIEERDQTILQLNGKLHELSQWVENLNLQIEERDELILNMNKQLHEVSNWAQCLNKQLADKDKQMSIMHEMIQERDKLLGQISNQKLGRYLINYYRKRITNPK